jgi:hypothetical protein
MKTAKLLDRTLSGLFRLALVILLFRPCGANATIEQTFEALQIGATTYRNVTVTTRSKDYIFILHSRGMTNVKVGDLPGDVRARLGYADPAAAQVKTNAPAVWARQTLSKIESPEVKQLEEHLMDWARGAAGMTRLSFPALSQKVILIASVAFLALYLFHSYCCLLICAKTGSKPGALVWLPLLQLFPLLRAAAMPRWWFLGFLVPGLNVVAQVVLCIKLAQARRKTFWVALFLIFPLTSPFAAIYLAFSGGRPRKRDDRRIEIMTLEAA